MMRGSHSFPTRSTRIATHIETYEGHGPNIVVHGKHRPATQLPSYLACPTSNKWSQRKVSKAEICKALVSKLQPSYSTRAHDLWLVNTKSRKGVIVNHSHTHNTHSNMRVHIHTPAHARTSTPLPTLQVQVITLLFLKIP